MARIRTVKPEFFLHEDLFDIEAESGLPVRLAFIGLWCQADREGRFRWRPRQLKAQIMPYDDGIDFSRVLDALGTRGFVVKYESQGEFFGAIPGFKRHQVINNREADSVLPAPQPENIIDHKNNGLTPESRVPDASPTRDVHAQAEGKGNNTTADSAKSAKSKNGVAYTKEFELAWAQYPSRAGDNPKPRAFKAWSARLREGHTAQEMIDGVRRYAAWCKATGKIGTETVKQAATFFGPDKAFLEPWTIPPQSNARAQSAMPDIGGLI